MSYGSLCSTWVNVFNAFWFFSFKDLDLDLAKMVYVRVNVKDVYAWRYIVERKTVRRCGVCTEFTVI